MERPTMKENLKGYSLEEAHKLYTDCPELYRYIVKLDEYIDDLEDKLNNLVIADVVKPFFCNNEKVGVRCTTQCLGCDGFERNE
jgi:hypothetical protein